MLGISYGELFLLLGATAALIGPKDLPIIARTAGRLAGRAIGYVQLARGQFDSVMQQTQARQVHKELQDTIAQLEAIRHEIRSISFVNPSPLTRNLMDNSENAPAKSGNKPLDSPQLIVQQEPHSQSSMPASNLGNMHGRAITFGKLAESPTIRLLERDKDVEKLDGDSGIPGILPVSAETAGLLPPPKSDVKGSDIVLEAVVEAEVAHNAKEFFAQAENQIKHE